MNDSLIDLETELRGLPLLPPSRRLLDGIGRALSDTPREAVALARPSTPAAGRYGRPLAWSGLGLAAALAVVATVGLLRFRPAETSAVASAVAVVPSDDQDESVGTVNGPDELRVDGPASLASDQSGRPTHYRHEGTFAGEKTRVPRALTASAPKDDFRVIPANQARYFHRPEGLVAQYQYP